MASAAIVYRKDKLNKKGLAPVHLRIEKAAWNVQLFCFFKAGYHR
jgi:hypothetical protein